MKALTDSIVTPPALAPFQVPARPPVSRPLTSYRNLPAGLRPPDHRLLLAQSVAAGLEPMPAGADENLQRAARYLWEKWQGPASPPPPPWYNPAAKPEEEHRVLSGVMSVGSELPFILAMLAGGATTYDLTWLRDASSHWEVAVAVEYYDLCTSLFADLSPDRRKYDAVLLDNVPPAPSLEHLMLRGCILFGFKFYIDYHRGIIGGPREDARWLQSVRQEYEGGAFRTRCK
jgi:hypothetical protein